MYGFTYDELRMIRFAIETEIIRREENPIPNLDKIQQFEDLHDKVYGMMQDMKSNN